MKQPHTTYAIIGVVAVLAGFFVGSLWKRAPSSETNTITIASSTLFTEEKPINVVTSGQTTFVTVNDQQAGPRVTVQTVKSKSVGWVVVSEDAAGKPGHILGARRVNPGETATQVELLRDTTRGGIYHAVLYKDDGDGEFDFKQDDPFQDAKGNLIEDTFRAL